jgi:CO/xanthine dehydrogenase Mo-binding subunit
MAFSRRKFLLGTGVIGGGLVLGLSLRDNSVPYPAAIEGSFNPNAWLQITEDGQFVFQLHKTEMGQGVIGSLPAILCEELDLDPQRLTIQHAGIHPDFADPSTGGQMTGGSTSVKDS